MQAQTKKLNLTDYEGEWSADENAYLLTFESESENLPRFALIQDEDEIIHCGLTEVFRSRFSDSLTAVYAPLA
ncbi:MAG: hypothetical protein FWD49_04670 [Firmicutes bacterium]|nr:hypothetical protein [Bacillota bacterium]